MDIRKRIYQDFFRPSMEANYEKILKSAVDNGYEFHTMLSFTQLQLKDELLPDKKYLILRRDIDTADSKILYKMLELEKKYGARATYYFRWSTIDIELMRSIESAGGEASYHYEEIATFCYKHRIRTVKDLMLRMEEVRDKFLNNIYKFRNYTGMPCLTVASHGDYVNTKLKFQSKELMDERVRTCSNIVMEAYDKFHMEILTSRIADQIEYDYTAQKTIEAIKRGDHIIELLTHPRQWNSPIWINLKEEITRVFKGLYMRL